jgi:hypothetical protein
MTMTMTSGFGFEGTAEDEDLEMEENVRSEDLPQATLEELRELELLAKQRIELERWKKEKVCLTCERCDALCSIFVG